MQLNHQVFYFIFIFIFDVDDVSEFDFSLGFDDGLFFH